MENAQKAIMIGVGLFITIIIIAAVMLITGIGQDLMNKSTNELSTLSSTLQDQITRQYDGVQVTGAQVLSAVQKYYSDPNMVILVQNQKGSTSNFIWVTPNKVKQYTTIQIDSNTGRIKVSNGIEENTSQPAYGTLTSATSSAQNRIVTTGQYDAHLIDLNGSVLGIAFIRK